MLHIRGATNLFGATNLLCCREMHTQGNLLCCGEMYVCRGSGSVQSRWCRRRHRAALSHTLVRFAPSRGSWLSRALANSVRLHRRLQRPAHLTVTADLGLRRPGGCLPDWQLPCPVWGPHGPLCGCAWMTLLCGRRPGHCAWTRRWSRRLGMDRQ